MLTSYDTTIIVTEMLSNTPRNVIELGAIHKGTYFANHTQKTWNETTTMNINVSQMFWHIASYYSYSY